MASTTAEWNVEVVWFQVMDGDLCPNSQNLLQRSGSLCSPIIKTSCSAFRPRNCLQTIFLWDLFIFSGGNLDYCVPWTNKIQWDGIIVLILEVDRKPVVEHQKRIQNVASDGQIGEVYCLLRNASVSISINHRKAVLSLRENWLLVL
jgi:hypothetical protein